MNPVLRWLGDGVRASVDIARERLDTDRVLMTAMAGFIEAAAHRSALDRGATWLPGEPLKLLFSGYAGSRNTGADVRVEEMIRQFRHLLGDEHTQLSILTIDPEATRGYFRTVRQLLLPDIFPKFLFDTVHTQHGVVTCEGSMFKSKFANALSTMMVGSLGIAAAEGKLAIGYGGEAGAMDPALERLVAAYCRDAVIIARNEASVDVLGRLGIRATSGTDTAWTFEPAPPAAGERVLRDLGWDGIAPVLGIAPINAFWWPVRPDLGRGIAHAFTGAHARAHYSSVYFHRDDDEVHAQQAAYLDALADAVRRFTAEVPAFVVLIGMEALDRSACEALAARLGGAPMVVSDDHDHRTMVSVLRRLRVLASSRYHALVCSMPGGVPSVGVTMDERIANLMDDRGTPDLCLRVDDADLADRLYAALVRLHHDGDAVAAGIRRTVVDNLVRMGGMGVDLVDTVRAHHPDFPFRPGLGSGGDPWAHLPPLPPALVRTIEEAA